MKVRDVMAHCMVSVRPPLAPFIRELPLSWVQPDA